MKTAYQLIKQAGDKIQFLRNYPLATTGPTVMEVQGDLLAALEQLGKLHGAVRRLLDAPDLNLDDLEPETWMVVQEVELLLAPPSSPEPVAPGAPEPEQREICECGRHPEDCTYDESDPESEHHDNH